VTEPTPTPVIATVTGKELLDKLDALASAFASLSSKMDNVPARLARIEEKNYVTWAQLGGVLTLLTVALGVVAAFLAVR
jgi:hypothetical protein